MFPSEQEIQLPLLRTLVAIGGKGKTKEIYPLVTKEFPQLNETDLAETLSSGNSKWTNRIQWVRQSLVERGEMASEGWGIWAITEKGRQRCAAEEITPPKLTVPPYEPDLLALYDKYESKFRGSMLSRLLEMTPSQFEVFAKQLLTAYGFAEVQVTKKSRDGGLDGFGKLKVGLALMDVAYQCKRWDGVIGRPEIDKFRGAIQGTHEQGIFFTTSDFTKEAKDASIKKGAVPVVLLNGQAIVSLMIEKEFGISRRPFTLFEDRLNELIDDVEA